MNAFFHPQGRSGAVLLITVLIVGSVLIVTSVAIALSGVGALSMGSAESQSLKAATLADGCAEEALLRLRRDPTYAGETLQMGGGTCTIVVTGETEKTILVSATVDVWVRRLRLSAAVISGRLLLRDWRQDLP